MVFIIRWTNGRLFSLRIKERERAIGLSVSFFLSGDRFPQDDYTERICTMWFFSVKNETIFYHTMALFLDLKK